MRQIRIFLSALLLGAALNGQAHGQAVTPVATVVSAPADENPANSQRKPCDILAADPASRMATPCVAAFSTVRALLSSYKGALYQVTRSSDSLTKDIPQLRDGYSDASSQDAFCRDTSCTITILYDQTGHANNLTVATEGHAATGDGPDGDDLPADADALPVQAGGHKVYGISIEPGMGYRNNTTKAVAVNGESEGVYMVTSAIPLLTKEETGKLSICCMDFGNAETDNNDNGAGAMDAINIQCYSTSGDCDPAANVDLENGVYGGLAIPEGTPFVTDMGANDGQDNYTIWQGNAQKGSLTTTGALSLPTVTTKDGKVIHYAPMKQEGAIILGIGGDNSDWAAGYFYEGVMTIGAPSDAAMRAIQQNIVAVGYATP